MRTTVTIDDELLRQARELALQQRRSLGDVVDDALRLLLAERVIPSPPVSLPTFGGSGLRPGVDLEDKKGLAALLGSRPIAGSPAFPACAGAQSSTRADRAGDCPRRA